MNTKNDLFNEWSDAEYAIRLDQITALSDLKHATTRILDTQEIMDF